MPFWQVLQVQPLASLETPGALIYKELTAKESAAPASMAPLPPPEQTPRRECRHR